MLLVGKPGNDPNIPLTQEQYVEQSRCPRCRHCNHISRGQISTEYNIETGTNKTFCKAWCIECRFTWREIYKKSGFEEGWP